MFLTSPYWQSFDCIAYSHNDKFLSCFQQLHKQHQFISSEQSPWSFLVALYWDLVALNCSKLTPESNVIMTTPLICILLMLTCVHLDNRNRPDLLSEAGQICTVLTLAGAKSYSPHPQTSSVRSSWLVGPPVQARPAKTKSNRPQDSTERDGAFFQGRIFFFLPHHVHIELP